LRQELTRALGVAAPGRRPSPHVRVAEAGQAPDPVLRVTTGTDGRVRIIGAGVPVCPPADPGLLATVRDLEHVARWTRIHTLDNPGSALAGAVTVDVVPARPGERVLPDDGRAACTEPVRLTYERTAGRWTPPSVFVRLTSTHPDRLYCTLLDLTDTYLVHAELFPGEHLAGRWTTAAAAGRPIRFALPPGRPAGPGASATDWLMLLVSESPFSTEPFALPRLGEPERPVHRSAAFGTVLEQLGMVANHREATVSAPVAADWAVSVLRVDTVVPDGPC